MNIERGTKNVIVGSIDLHMNRNPEALLKVLSGTLKYIKGKGYGNLTFSIEENNGRGDEPYSLQMILCGDRPETEEEWHCRLVGEQDSFQRALNNGRTIMLKESDIKKKIKKIDDALTKSSLVCVECGKPCLIKFMGKRMCIECKAKEKR